MCPVRRSGGRSVSSESSIGTVGGRDRTAAHAQHGFRVAVLRRHSQRGHASHGRSRHGVRVTFCLGHSDPCWAIHTAFLQGRASWFAVAGTVRDAFTALLRQGAPPEPRLRAGRRPSCIGPCSATIREGGALWWTGPTATPAADLPPETSSCCRTQPVSRAANSSRPPS